MEKNLDIPVCGHGIFTCHVIPYLALLMWGVHACWPKTLPIYESGQGTGKWKSTLAGSKRWNKDLCLLFPVTGRQQKKR